MKMDMSKRALGSLDPNIQEKIGVWPKKNDGRKIFPPSLFLAQTLFAEPLF